MQRFSDEIRAALREGGMTLGEPVGVTYNPLTDQFSLGADTSVNYMAVAEKPAG